MMFPKNKNFELVYDLNEINTFSRLLFIRQILIKGSQDDIVS